MSGKFDISGLFTALLDVKSGKDKMLDVPSSLCRFGPESKAEVYFLIYY